MFFSSACQARINDKVSRRENKWLLLIYNNLLIWKWTYQKRNTTKQRVDKRFFWNNISVLIFCDTKLLFREKNQGKIIRLEVQNCKRIFRLGKVNHCAVSILLNWNWIWVEDQAPPSRATLIFFLFWRELLCEKYCLLLTDRLQLWFFAS